MSLSSVNLTWLFWILRSSIPKSLQVGQITTLATKTLRWSSNAVPISLSQYRAVNFLFPVCITLILRNAVVMLNSIIFLYKFRRRISFRKHGARRLGCWCDSPIYFALYALWLFDRNGQNSQFHDERYMLLKNPWWTYVTFYLFRNSGHIANIIKRVINAKIPYVPWITGYIAMLVGAGITFLVQSSSVFTSTLTPLVGIGVISIERVYPLTLGSNIGTTTTALIAALAADQDKLHDTLQISLVHLFFNITGILLFYPIPFMRFPIPMAKFLGNETAKYRWFAILYLVGMFFILPGMVLGLSIAGTVALLCVGIPILLIFISIAVIKTIQKKKPSCLPRVMRDWKWLPTPCRSLEPYDRQFAKCACCKKFRPTETPTNVIVSADSVSGNETKDSSLNP